MNAGDNIKPIISVIIPCYNQACFLEETLHSVIEQTVGFWECFIVNDGSTDETEIIGKSWELKDKRFKYLFKTNGGLSSARNFGISNATGTYILPLDADDRISNNYIETCYETFSNGTQNLKIVYGVTEFFGDRTGAPAWKEFSWSNLLKHNMIQCTAMFRKENWELIGGYDEKMKSGLEDWEFWIRLLDKNSKVIKLESAVFFYRYRHNSMIRSLKEQEISKIRFYIFNKHADKYFDFFNEQIDKLEKLEKKNNRISYLLKQLFKLVLKPAN